MASLSLSHSAPFEPIKYYLNVLSGPFWNVWILKGNYSGSMLFDSVPMSDPLMTAESLATGYLPEWTTILGALIIVAFMRSWQVKPFVVGFAQ
ncbi:quinol dehydrogenase membrane component [Actinobacillus equuli]|nr:quinol dehydrogenase membrane component [Actinobacillus equuli]